MLPDNVAILHYSAPPVIGGVESVIHAHCQVFKQAGLHVTVVSGRGTQLALGDGIEYRQISLMDSQNPDILSAARALDSGSIPENFEQLTEQLVGELGAKLSPGSVIIAHNIFSKHFNLPLTAALQRLNVEGSIGRMIAWCHDISATSEGSREKIHPGFPWDLIRQQQPDVTYVAISEMRQAELAGLFHIPTESIPVISNGISPENLLGLSGTIMRLATDFSLWQADLVMLMPVRITRAKNIEFAMRLTAALLRRKIRLLTILTGPPDPHNSDSQNYYYELLTLRAQLAIDAAFRFVYDSGPNQEEPYCITSNEVGELYRLSDLLLMTSHREGFGMPVLEAGLSGLPALTTHIPATVEIGKDLVWQFSPEDSVDDVADMLIDKLLGSPTYHFRKLVRQNYTWERIYQRQIVPLICKNAL